MYLLDVGDEDIFCHPYMLPFHGAVLQFVVVYNLQQCLSAYISNSLLKITGLVGFLHIFLEVIFLILGDVIQ